MAAAPARSLLSALLELLIELQPQDFVLREPVAVSFCWD